ncbi:hypothetical protein GCM10010909_22790 [Acidocella aquatica]|uniref:Ankyrin repeat domain-containing protein n=1 Tax=Acidocella aquatica TaxID=1922313 RepID=A0ABQ6A7J6_9PROT|nr:ankyrin repeat domain-containing protein [Acidocella aquatica]GLR67598.1 hypothetical protein GCM10010909_22790 [Acidocella aquatica]
MRYIPASALGLALLLAGAPAFAQMSMGGAPGGAPGGGGVQPQPQVHDIAPPALPGAGAPAPLATAPVVQKPAIADPTQALFAAVNSGDYNAAQDALSRGADLTAKNDLGETPLDLSIALNHTNITFLLLATRNETAGSDGTTSPGPAFTATAPARPAPRKSHPAAPVHEAATPHTTEPAVNIAPGNNPGTPNPSAGFLGFGTKN